MNLGPTELVVLALFLGFPLWALIDVLRASDAEWASVGQQRSLWVALIGIGTVCGGPVGTVMAVVYLVSVRPKLLATRSAGP